jgi:hypothetical protein
MIMIMMMAMIIIIIIIMITIISPLGQPERAVGDLSGGPYVFTSTA